MMTWIDVGATFMGIACSADGSRFFVFGGENGKGRGDSLRRPPRAQRAAGRAQGPVRPADPLLLSRSRPRLGWADRVGRPLPRAAGEGWRRAPGGRHDRARQHPARVPGPGHDLGCEAGPPVDRFLGRDTHAVAGLPRAYGVAPPRLRGSDSLVFALLFVAAVGLGPAVAEAKLRAIVDAAAVVRTGL